MILTFCELNVSVETQELSLQTAEEKDEDKETESDEPQDADAVPTRSYVLLEGRRNT